MQELENWLDAVGFEGLYQISDLGNVRSLTRTTSHNRLLSGRPLKSHCNGYGYMTVMLRKSGKSVRRYVHRMVLEAFCGPCPDGMEARHFNGIRHDNRLNNLEWATHIDNVADRKLHGTHRAGEDNNLAVLKESDVVLIREMYASGVATQKQIGEKYGITQSGVGRIVRGQAWVDAPGPITKTGVGQYVRRKNKPRLSHESNQG